MEKQRESFEDWWSRKGHLYPTSLKEGLWITFSDGWYRSEKSRKAEKEEKRVSAPHLTPAAQDEMERKFAMQDRAMELLQIIAAEFQSDPTSVQCFDLHIVEEVKTVAREYPKLKDLY